MVKTVYPVSVEIERELQELRVVGVGGAHIPQERYEAVIKQDIRELRKRLGVRQEGQDWT